MLSAAPGSGFDITSRHACTAPPPKRTPWKKGVARQQMISGFYLFFRARFQVQGQNSDNQRVSGPLKDDVRKVSGHCERLLQFAHPNLPLLPLRLDPVFAHSRAQPGHVRQTAWTKRQLGGAVLSRVSRSADRLIVRWGDVSLAMDWGTVSLQDSA